MQYKVTAKYSKLGYAIFVGSLELMRRGNSRTNLVAVTTPTSRYAIALRELQSMVTDITRLVASAPELYKDQLARIGVEYDRHKFTLGTVDRVPTETVDRDLQHLRLIGHAIDVNKIHFQSLQTS
jgi:hypothetical protein